MKRIKFWYKHFGLQETINAIVSRFTKETNLITVTREDIKFPFYLRGRTTDIPTFEQIFVNQEYNFETTTIPKVIVDAGANVGLTSIYFANKYPNAKIIAIEPEKSNYEMLIKNVSSYTNIIALNVALWNQNEEIELVDPGLGKWGFMTQNSETDDDHGILSHKVKAMTVDQIMKDHNLERINILKIDIEGAEKEVFADTSLWLEKVDALIVELHDRMKSGCASSFYNGSNGFDIEWIQGENIYKSRKNFLKKSHSH
ncbi:MAG: FkbM family methyltransferase [Proteobacteria bacterium]|jgi:FkbM family methyltransferase|nr:FkbM family methyltransferase [Pseudomonadota bacterium]